MTKVSAALKITVADYTVTTGTEQFFGFYYANITLTKANPSIFYVYVADSNVPAFVQRLSNNMLRVYVNRASTSVTVRVLYIPILSGG